MHFNFSAPPQPPLKEPKNSTVEEEKAPELKLSDEALEYEKLYMKTESEAWLLIITFSLVNFLTFILLFYSIWTCR